MKNYQQLLKELPSTTVVINFGGFNPPTAGHELLIKTVKKLAEQKSADHVIYSFKDPKNALLTEKKEHYLRMMFPKTNFKIDTSDTILEAAKELNKKYKNLIVVGANESTAEFKRILESRNGKDYQFQSIEVVSAGNKNPDSDTVKMKTLASKGIYEEFKSKLPNTVRELDSRRLMNDLRIGMGLDAVKEQFVFNVDSIREKYYRGEIYHIGEIVESANERFEIVDRGSNYLVVVDSEGTTHRKWLKDVKLSENQLKEDILPGPVPTEITFKGYTTQNLHHSEDARRAFQETIQRKGAEDPVAVLNALKATDAYMKINDHHLEDAQAPDPKDMAEWRAAHVKAKDSLDRIGEFMHHEDYWHMHDHEIEDMISDYKEQGKDELSDSTNIEGTMLPEDLTDKTLKSNDKVKVARIIASMLGIDNPESSTSPEQLVNNALRKVRSKALNADGLKILTKMLQLANEVKIDYDRSLMPTKLKEANDNRKNNESDIDAEAEKTVTSLAPKMGHTMDGGNNDQLRRRKIRYKLGESYEAAEHHKKLANEAKAKGDMSAHHYHMSNHHEELGKWHESKGRHNAADREYERAEKHHNIGVGMHEETDLDEVNDYFKRRQREKEAEMGKPAKRQPKNPQNDYFARRKKEKANEEVVSEVSSSLLDRYKEKAKKSADELTAQGKHKKSTDRWMNVMKATGKQIDKTTAGIKKALNKEEFEELHEEHLVHVNDGSKYGDKPHPDDEKHVMAGVKKHHGEYDGMSDKGIYFKFKKHEDAKAFKRHVDSCPKRSCDADLHEETQASDKAAKETAKANLAAKQAREKETLVAKQAREKEQLMKKEEVEMDADTQHQQNLEDQMAQELDLTDEQLDAIIDSAQDDDYLEAYEPEELGVVDADTGEEIKEEEPMSMQNEEALMEVLSRIERIRAKARFARTASKRERRIQIALKRHSDNKTINTRARKLAVALMKKRLLRGRNINGLSVGEKERIERVIQRKKDVIGRVAMKLVPRVRKVEKARLSHTKYTKGTPSATF